jgi:HPt (histidine-containing phosphotransfer) domain-containing protein
MESKLKVRYSHDSPRADALTVPGDRLKELRARFFESLKDERQRLLDLGAALARGERDHVPVLHELHSLAHCLSGTASVLELRGVAALARALELAVEEMAAADRALVPRAENADRLLRATLRALIQKIDSLGKPAPGLRLHARIAALRRARRILNG